MQKTKRFFSLFMVLGGGVLGAFLLVGSLIYFHGPSGNLHIKNILISPKTIDKLDAKHDARAIKNINYTFFDYQKNQWKSSVVSLPQYAQFYANVENLKTIINPKEIEESSRSFSQANFLAFYIHSQVQSQELLQEIQFSHQEPSNLALGLRPSAH